MSQCSRAVWCVGEDPLASVCPPEAVFRPARTEPVPVPSPVTLGTKVLMGERPAFKPFKVNP